MVTLEEGKFKDKVEEQWGCIYAGSIRPAKDGRKKDWIRKLVNVKKGNLRIRQKNSGDISTRGPKTSERWKKKRWNQELGKFGMES